MLKQMTLTLGLIALPLGALALPNVGDAIGTTPEAVTAALEDSGCTLRKFEAEKGKIEAKCSDAEGREWEIYIDPASGYVTKVELDD